MSHTTQRISILVFDGCMATEAFAISDILTFADRVIQHERGTDETLFRVELVSPASRTVTAAGGFALSAIAPETMPEVLVVPGFDFGRPERLTATLQALAPERDYIRAARAGGAAVISVCVGSFLLAEAGILDGREATTAWLFADEFARRYPAVRLKADALLVQDAGVMTAGAFSAAFDVSLHLLRGAGGEALAARIAGMTLLDRGRDSQAPFVDRRGPERRGFAGKVRDALNRRFDQPYDLQRLAAELCVSPRTLLRRFKEESGLSPLAYLQTYRIHVAKELLQSSSLSVARITETVGYADTATFSSLFKRQVRLTPQEYRHRFRVKALAGTDGG